MNRPCLHAIKCVGPIPGLEADSPITNYSSEYNDGIDFYGIRWPIFDPFDPEVPAWWSADSCITECISFISQADADACAAILEILCVPHPDPDPDPIPPNPETQFYYSQQQTCTARCPDGTYTYWTLRSGWVVSTSQILADRIASSLACQLANRSRICLGALSSQPCSTAFYTGAFQVTGGSTPFTFSVVGGTMPPGLSVGSAGPRTGIIGGIATVPGIYNVRIRATPAGGANYAERDYTIRVLGFTCVFASGTTGTAYDVTLTADGGTAPYSFSLQDGTLPAGLAIVQDPDGSWHLRGTPTLAETQDFNLRVTDTSLRACVTPFSIEVVSSCPSSISTLNAGDNVGGVAYPLTGAIYTFESSSVRVLDRVTGALLSTILSSNPHQPADLVYVPSTDRLWVSWVDGFSVAEPEIQQINPNTMAGVSNHLSAGMGIVIDSMVYHSGNNVVVCLEQDQGLLTDWLISINVATMVRTNRVDYSGTSINAIGYSSVSNRIYVARAIGAAIDVYDGTYTLIDTIVLPNVCSSMAYVPTTNKLYASHSNGIIGRVSVIDCATNTIDTSVLLTTLDASLGTNGSSFVCAVYGVSAQFISTASNTISCTRALAGSGGTPYWDNLGRIHIGELGAGQRVFRLE